MLIHLGCGVGWAAGLRAKKWAVPYAYAERQVDCRDYQQNQH